MKEKKIFVRQSNDRTRKVYAIMVFSSRYLYTQTLVNFLDNFNDENYKSLSLNVINLTIFIDPSKESKGKVKMFFLFFLSSLIIIFSVLFICYNILSHDILIYL